MKKFVTLGIAAAFAALSFTAVTTAPAHAGGISFGFGGFDDGFDYGDWDDDDVGVVIEIDPEDFEVDTDDGDTDRHVEWCEEHYTTYNEDTDMYFYKPGKQKRCISPFS